MITSRDIQFRDPVSSVMTTDLAAAPSVVTLTEVNVLLCNYKKGKGRSVGGNSGAARANGRGANGMAKEVGNAVTAATCTSPMTPPSRSPQI
jgi:hypothetical protein